jgi:hypothetical protein
MSDEPKKRSRAWMGWTVFLFVFLAYTLSIGPAWRWVLSADSITEAQRRLKTVHGVYAPVFWLKWNFELPDRVIGWYIGKWDPLGPGVMRCCPARR